MPISRDVTVPRMTLSAHAVYTRTIGRRTTVTNSMMPSVVVLDDEFHTVRLERASMLDGRMNGNIDTPTVAMMPIVASEEPPKASYRRRARMPISATNAPANPARGASSVAGAAA